MKPITNDEIRRWESLLRDPCVEWNPIGREDMRRLLKAVDD